MGKISECKNTGQRAQGRAAATTGQMVRLWRSELEHGSFCGYVGGVGREFFLMWVLGDSVNYDGLYVMRHRDVGELEVPDKHHIFLEKALALKQMKPEWPEAFPLDDIREVVQAAALCTPVIGVHVDSEDEAEVCYIGRLIDVDDEGFRMQEISPDAEWLTDASFFGWDEVSTVSIGDGYAQSLLQVAGAPPPLSPGDSGVGQLR